MRQTRDTKIATGLGVPRSTVSGWLNSPVQEIVTHEVFDLDDLQVRRRILNLERRLRIVTAIMVLLLALIRTFRIHPSKPVLGLRCDAADETWHIDVTVIRLLDGTKAYLQAIIDNYSRRILAWRLGESLEPGSTATLLAKAYEGRSSVGKNEDPQPVMVDAGAKEH